MEQEFKGMVYTFQCLIIAILSLILFELAPNFGKQVLALTMVLIAIIGAIFYWIKTAREIELYTWLRETIA